MLKSLVYFSFFFGLFTNTMFSQTAEELIQKNLDARGGEENLKNIKTFRVIGRIETEGVELGMAYYFKVPDRCRLQIDIMGQSGITIIKNDSAWIVDPSQNISKPKLLTDEEKSIVKPFINSLFSFHSAMLVDYKSKSIKLEYKGKEFYDNSETYKVLVSLPEGLEIVYFIDEHSFLDKRHDIYLPNQVLTITLKDFTLYKNVLIPRMIESRIQDKRITRIIIDNIQINNEIEDSIFEVQKN